MNFKCCGCHISDLLLLTFATSILFVGHLIILFRYKILNSKQIEWEMLKPNYKYPGEMGSAVNLPSKLSKRAQKLLLQGWQENKFNKYVSDIIPLNRTLPDIQDEWCKQPNRFLKKLPPTDIIICFHNEAWSTLLRTVHSVINRSPDHLIEKIILVDDYSDMDHLKEPFEAYFSTYAKVKIVRALTREGLTKSRLLGMKHSSARVLTFLDSHCECTKGWLEPLLDRIARNPFTVATPFIDIIDMTTFEYYVPPLRDSKYIGGFNWHLEYIWINAPNREREHHKDDLEPLFTPTIAGGLFSIDRNFFEYLGTYDPGFEYWGAENLELSFKAWMCGGSMEMVYCSRVGHVFREETPFKYPSAGNTVIKNLVRLAEVWLDNYAQIFYKSMGQGFNLTAASSDVRKRKLLRKNLGCKTFKWYLENVYPDKFVPVAMGSIVNIRTNVCLQADDRVGNLDVFICHNHGGNQFWMFGDLGEIRKDEVCLMANGTQPFLTNCSLRGAQNEHWFYNNRTYQILNKATKQCLTLDSDRERVLMKHCQKRNWRQQWILK